MFFQKGNFWVGLKAGLSNPFQIVSSSQSGSCVLPSFWAGLFGLVPLFSAKGEKGALSESLSVYHCKAKMAWMIAIISKNSSFDNVRWLT